MFHGVGALVIAIILRSTGKLVKSTLGKDHFLWAIFALIGLITASTASEKV